MGMTLENAAAFVRTENEQWSKVVKSDDFKLGWGLSGFGA